MGGIMEIKITGTIFTQHIDAASVAAAVKVDNMSDIVTALHADDSVVTTITGTSFSRVIATMDDYLMNLTVADEIVSKRVKKQTDTSSI
jgi:hypothetical protein